MYFAAPHFVLREARRFAAPDVFEVMKLCVECMEARWSSAELPELSMAIVFFEFSADHEKGSLLTTKFEFEFSADHEQSSQVT